MLELRCSSGSGFKKNMMNKKSTGLIVLALIYAFAIILGVLFFAALSPLLNNDLLTILIADVISTVFVWASGLVFKTASVYDPYWSVQSFIIYLLLLIKYHNWNVGTILVLSVIFLYTLRLTGNFIIGFDSLKYVDWRYKMLKEKSGKAYQLVNLLGICLFPTLVVYSASVPLFIYAQIGTFSYLNIIGLVIVLGGVLLELVSDLQMKKFIKTRTDRSQIINIGLWNYSRHPNYLGEILIWFGVGAILIIPYPQYWFYFVGAIINLLMFLIISIPMEEKHMREYKPGLDDYKKQTSMLFILPRKKVEEQE